MAEEKNEKTAVEGKPRKKPGGASKPKRSKSETSSQAEVVQLAAEGEVKISPKNKPRLEKRFHDAVVPVLMKEFQFKNVMQVPRLTKVVVNCAIKEAVGNPRVLDHAVNDLMLITGQKPILTRARKAIATFKLRKGIPLGVCVTLRRARMYEFLDRLMNVALPRVRDFRGVTPKAFDGRGNCSFGIREQIIFPEINYDKVDTIRGMTVTIVTTAKNNDQARLLLTELGMPFRK